MLRKSLLESRKPGVLTVISFWQQLKMARSQRRNFTQKNLAMLGLR
jgi:hypothetical protein